MLVERLGGPSVKPYQPEGLWQEVAMLQSNTREYARGADDALWRRSLYTYWKRACPPPSMLTLDAPTREFCTIRRAATNTPLQALVLWNDEQFVEAARALAARVLATRSLAEGAADDAPTNATAGDGARIGELWRRCTGRRADDADRARSERALVAFRERYANAPDEAKLLVDVGESMAPAELDARELAAWTMLASAILNLDAAITRN
ncbi:MAG: DUF1553 domain-containing protein [Planctomycetota bacterium]|nr:MAG: DUF1553 domain-containing protein [Planctomycetota bacterium]